MARNKPKLWLDDGVHFKVRTNGDLFTEVDASLFAVICTNLD